MLEFPRFVRHEVNRIATASQFTEDIEGFVFDGADGSQVAFFTAFADRASAPHTHDFDEYVLVVAGACSVRLPDRTVELGAGDELVVPRGTEQSMTVRAGTRTVHVFGGRRARRESETRA
jgi:mannose-6-phosphate isomerase-like protein (cupin superfamily)